MYKLFDVRKQYLQRVNFCFFLYLQSADSKLKILYKKDSLQMAKTNNTANILETSGELTIECLKTLLYGSFKKDVEFSSFISAAQFKGKFIYCKLIFSTNLTN